MIHTIGNLPNRHNLFTLKNYAIYILDDYSVHFLPEIRQALLKKGYVLVGIGGGITGDVQINETDMHAPLKSKYRELEAELMIEQLQSNPNKIPQPSKDDMMRMLDVAWKSVLGRVDVDDRFKALWVTNNFDGSEDFLVSQKIMDLVGTEMIEYRKRLMEKESPKTLKQLISKIRPPKGVRRKGEGNKPWDEGIEMSDCEGDVMEDEAEGNDVEEEVENEEEENSHNAQMSNVSQPEGSSVPDSTQKVDQLSEQFPEFRKDIEFLHEISKLIETHGPNTTKRFTSHIVQLETTYRIARLSLRKRMRAEVDASKSRNTNVEVVEENHDSSNVSAEIMGSNENGDEKNDEIPITFVSDMVTTLIVFDSTFSLV